MNAMAPKNIVWQNLRRYVSPLVTQRFGFMTADEEARVEAVRQRRLLYRGQHRAFYIDEARSQFPVQTLKVNGEARGVYVPFNLLGLITRKEADLLFGEPPAITSDDDSVQVAVESIERRSHLRRVLFEAAVTCSWAGWAFLEISNSDQGAFISSPAVDEIFPVGPPGPDGQYAVYRRYATENVGTAEVPIVLLLITTYRVGEIARELWQLGRDGGKAASLELSAWPAFKAATPQPIEKTNLEHCSIVFVPNELIEGEAVSDYDIDVIEQQDLVNAKQSQLARTLAIHGNPRMYFPTGSADADGMIRVNDDAFFGDTPDAKPQYVEMAGKPDAAMTDRDFAVTALCVRMEMTPELIGIKNNAAADSARKMRLASSSPLAKVERRTAYWQPAIQRAMTIAVRVELNRPIEDGAIGVEIRDGLPEDELDTATIIQTLRAADVLSDERALAMLGLDAGAADEELSRIKAKRDAQMPSVLLDESGEAPNASGEDADNAAQRPGESPEE